MSNTFPNLILRKRPTIFNRCGIFVLNIAGNSKLNVGIQIKQVSLLGKMGISCFHLKLRKCFVKTQSDFIISPRVHLRSPSQFPTFQLFETF
jgi:hypothetical protein